MPVFFEPGARPRFCEAGKALELHAVEIAETLEENEQFASRGD
jgi:hypothetical protein